MQVADYRLEELRFAYCYHAFLHWRTHRRKPYPPLTILDKNTLHALVEPLGLHVLECDNRPTECRVLTSLQPAESVSACASKLKGRVSKWLRQQVGLQEAQALLARGYFACTSGGTTAQRVEAYLDAQSDHHGYSQRILPPVFANTYQPDAESQPWWHAEHACTHLQYHIVLATAGRRGVFGADEGAAIAGGWGEMQREQRMALRKVSFVPDHVHIALWLHPAVAPADAVLALMNQAQRLMAARFSGELVRAGLGRLWQPSAYLGSYGDLATPQVQAYIRRWQAME
jgi:REP element-mobilizing transposase RayT